MKEFVITPNEANQRFDKYLKKRLPQASTGFLYKMLRKKNIILNGKKAEGTELLQKDDVVKFFFSDETFEKFSTDPDVLLREFEALKKLPMAGIEIVYEDDDILVADKPYNLLSQKAVFNDTSANEYLLGYLIRSGALSFEEYKTFKPSVCNRLDRNTTGLILVGKTLKGLQYLSENLRNRSIQKFYRAIVSRPMSEDAYLSGYLIKDEKNNMVEVRKEKTEGSSAIETSYHVIRSFSNATYLEIHLITGKTHQIRAHLASIGHPVVGDMKYGNAKTNQYFYEEYRISHQLLHAYRVGFPDARIITSKEPKAFERCLHALDR